MLYATMKSFEGQLLIKFLLTKLYYYFDIIEQSVFLPYDLWLLLPKNITIILITLAMPMGCQVRAAFYKRFSEILTFYDYIKEILIIFVIVLFYALHLDLENKLKH